MDFDDNFTIKRITPIIQESTGPKRVVIYTRVSTAKRP